MANSDNQPGRHALLPASLWTGLVSLHSSGTTVTLFFKLQSTRVYTRQHIAHGPGRHAGLAQSGQHNELFRLVLRARAQTFAGLPVLQEDAPQATA